MNFKKHLSVIAPIVTLFAISGSAFADRYANSVRYDLVVQHAHDLEYIATDLKDCFRNQFRGTRNYGKLISRSNKLRNRSRDLYRHGVARGNCNWQVEIQRLDDIVCELNDLVDETIFRSRRGYGAPLCGNAVRTVRRLMGKAEYHVRELQRSLFQVGTRSFKQPVFQPNILESPAPSYLPPTGIHRTQTGIGSGVYRSGPSYKPHWTQSRYDNGVYRGRSGIDFNRQGVALNLGGFRINF